MIAEVLCHGRRFFDLNQFGLISFANGEAFAVSCQCLCIHQFPVHYMSAFKLGLYTLMTQTPTYFRVIHGWNVQWVGWLSGFPHFFRMGFAYLFSKWCDSMLRQNKVSRTNVRKLACALCSSINSIFVLALAFSGCEAWVAVSCVAFATIIHGAVSSGPLANVIDISPNYSGIILGLTGAISVFPGFISPYIVGKLTLNNVSLSRQVFFRVEIY